MNKFDLPIVGPSNDVPQDDPQRTLNLYAEKVSDDVYTLKPTPGDEVWTTLDGTGTGRGQITVGGRYFAVRAGVFYEVVAGVSVSRGVLLSITGKVGITACLPPNGEGQIGIVDEDTLYVFKLATNDFLISGIDFSGFVGGGSQIAFAGERAIAFKPGTSQFQESNLVDFTVWNGLAFATCQSFEGEPIVALCSDGQYVWFFSKSRMETWQVVDTVPQSLQKVTLGINIGTEAPNSVYLFERYVYWLGGSQEGKGVVWRMTTGGRPERISDHSNERQIASFPDASDCNTWCYQSLGHRFIVLNFPAGNSTLCYDATTGIWHNRCVRDPVSARLSLVPYLSVIEKDGMLLGQDYKNGKIYRIDNQIFTNSGAPIVRDRVLPPLPQTADWMTYYQSIELFGEVGNTPTGQEDPNVMLRLSTDRGETWGIEDWQKTGGNSSYETRVRWTGIGAAYGLTIWFRIVASQYISWRNVRVRAE